MRPRTEQRRHFSLLEVVLALVVIGFGLISVMALLPASVKAERDAMASTHSARAAENVMQIVDATLEAATTLSQWQSQALDLPTGKPGPTEPTEGWTEWLDKSGIHYWRAGIDDEFVRVEMRRPGNDSSEFSGVCRLWREAVTISEYDNGIWSTRTLSTDEAIALNVEISWPARVPYARRQKALYALNVFRQE